MGNQSEENGGWQYGCLGMFLLFLIMGGISNLFDSSNKSSNKIGFSLTSIFSNKAYKTYWNKNMLVIKLPYPTKGIVGINEVSWGKVDVM